VSVGIEDWRDLLADFERAIEKIRLGWGLQTLRCHCNAPATWLET